MVMKTKNIITTINYCAFTLVMIASSICNASNWLVLMSLYFIFLVFYSANTFFIHDIFNKSKKIALLNITIYFLEVLLIFFINRFDISFISITLYMFLLEDIVINQKIPIGIVSFFLMYTAACISIFSKLNYDSSKAVTAVLIALPVFIITYIIFFLIKYLIKQTSIIENNLKDITIRKLEKDMLYTDLKAAYERVETMTALKERNRIAREIHDTVGHTLTTVLVQLEASKRLIQKAPDTASEKLGLAQEQVRKGLNDIRSSVRVLENGNDIFDFYSEINSIIAETEKHSEVIIKSQVDENIQFEKPQEKIILSALLEGLTNGIKHGRSSAFLFKIYKRDKKLCISLEDNGNGSDIVTPGFGLRAMKERIVELNGSINISSKTGEGFGLYISFPT